MTFVASALTFLLGIPAVRVFIEDIVLRVFSELLVKVDVDPKFHDQFLAQSRAVGLAQTEEGKRAELQKLRDLRASTQPL